MAVDAAGRIFTATEACGKGVQIYKLDGHGGASQVGNINGPFTQLGCVTGLTVDKQDRLIVATNDSVNIYAPNGNGNVGPVKVIHSTPQVLVGDGDVKVDASGNLFANGNGAAALEFNPVTNGLLYGTQPALAVSPVIFPLAVSPGPF